MDLRMDAIEQEVNEDRDSGDDLTSTDRSIPDSVATCEGYRKKYRSKSAVSSDPLSPYFTSQGFSNVLGGRFHKAPSVSCVPGYDGVKYEQAGEDWAKYGRHRWQNGNIPGLNLNLSPDDPKAATIRQRYYPEGGWGWVICVCSILVEIITNGFQASFGFFLINIQQKFGKDASLTEVVCLGAMSTSITLFLSPVVVAFCRRRNPRLVAVLGGLITALGCLFTSFASRFQHMYVSYGVFIGCGASLTRETSILMVGQYFKRKRELVEIIISSGTGIGIATMPLLVTESVKALGWTLGLQLVTGMVFFTFILGVFYRPASLYHPQRRAILHMKELQRRSKAKDKNVTAKEKHPFFDLDVLKSRTVQILICGTGLAAFGVNSPLLFIIYQGQQGGLDNRALTLLQVFLGLASALGSSAFGFIVVKNSVQCMIARQYLCQAASLMVSASLLAFPALQEFQGYVLFVWIYGIFYGGYHYSLKMFAFEKVRARNFARAWGYVQWSQAIPNAIGLSVTGYINDTYGSRSGFYLSSALIFLGSSTLFLIDIHKKNVKKRKTSLFSEGRRCSEACISQTFSRRSSIQDSMNGRNVGRPNPRSLTFNNATDLKKQELTCISEEVLMDNFLDDYMDITSCNKEEKFLMLSEYENNLNKTQETLDGDVRVRPTRKISVVTPPCVEQCPNCLRYLAKEGSTSAAGESSRMIGPLRQISRTACDDVIEELTSSV